MWIITEMATIDDQDSLSFSSEQTNNESDRIE